MIKCNFDLQRVKKERVRDRVVGTTKVAAATEEEYVKKTKQILETLQQFSFLVLASNKTFADQNFKNLTLLSPDYLDFGLIEPNGRLFSSAVTNEPTPNLEGTSLFRAVMQQKDFVMGRVDESPGKLPGLTFAMPVVDEQSELKRIIYASLDLSLLSSTLARIPIPPEGVMSVVDMSGDILAQYPATNWIGRNTATDPFTAMLFKTRNGVFETKGLDGVERLYACTTVGDGSHSLFIVTIGLPLHGIYAQATIEFYRNLAVVLIVVVVLLAAAWLISNKLLLQPINAVISASARLAKGDLTARTRIQGSSEIHRLARNFDLMAESLAMRDAELKRAHREILEMNAELERKVQARTLELSNANQELEAFSYSVSHDLRAPLRHMDGFANLLLEDDNIQVNERALRFVTRITKSAKQMGVLIDELLDFSRMGRQAILCERLDTNSLVQEVLQECMQYQPERAVQWKVHKLPQIMADRAMMKQVWVNLVSNAVKYSRGKDPAVIEIGFEIREGEETFYIRDNGAGFDMKYADKLFGVFQRLHRETEFEGTGIGLANIRRIIHRHGGRTWAEGEVDKGATFYFSLPADSVILQNGAR
ncbi:MAG: ATP-binding protein [Verrucomicrobiota bacterium]